MHLPPSFSASLPRLWRGPLSLKPLPCLPAFRQLHISATALNTENTAEQPTEKAGAVQRIGRFYKQASVKEVDEGYTVMLDHRALKTPMRKPFVVPTEELAHVVAFEWDAQGKTIQPASLHVTSLCNTALDNPARLTREQRIENLVPFLATDTLCFREDTSDALVTKQKELWDPLVDWFQMRYGASVCVTFKLFEQQHPECIDVLKQELDRMSELTLTAFELATDTAKSAIIALAMYERAISAQEATNAARLEIDFQTQRFGEVEWAHTLEKYDTQARLAAAAVVMRLADQIEE
eukprot:m.30374 g.30374  ORF g.30374 m.30374 type:complete len:294 (-) comp10602_c1_seq2:117-998(-)